MENFKKHVAAATLAIGLYSTPEKAGAPEISGIEAETQSAVQKIMSCKADETNIINDLTAISVYILIGIFKNLELEEEK